MQAAPPNRKRPRSPSLDASVRARHGLAPLTAARTLRAVALGTPVNEQPSVRDVAFAATDAAARFGHAVRVEAGGVAATATPAGSEVWKPVPDIEATDLLASSAGRFRTRGSHPSLGAPHRGFLQQSGYYRVTVQRNNYQAHHLICTAFHGKRPSPKHTANHLDHDTTNNAASNLAWATKSEQVSHQRKRRRQATSEPVLSRKLGSRGEWVAHISAHQAALTLGLQMGAINHVLAGRTRRAGAYTFKRAPPRETQLDLEGEGFMPAGKPTEQWVNASNRLRMSNRGRVQTITPRGNRWTHRRTPVRCDAHTYVFVRYNGKNVLVHRLVYKLFGGRQLRPGETVDHIDGDPTNNSINNLRPATRSTQSRNQARQHKSKINFSRKKPLLARPLDGSLSWERFAGQREAVETLRSRYPLKKFSQGGVGAVIRGENKYHLGWIFKSARAIRA